VGGRNKILIPIILNKKLDKDLFDTALLLPLVNLRKNPGVCAICVRGPDQNRKQV
jgi:hypothetical protein